MTVPVHRAVTLHGQLEQVNDTPAPTTCCTLSGPLGQETAPCAMMHAAYGLARLGWHSLRLQPADRGLLAVHTRSCDAYVTAPVEGVPGETHTPPVGPGGTYSMS